MSSEDKISDAFKYDPAVNYDDATIAQQRQIEQQISNAQSLIGERESFENLEKEYAEDTVYLQKIQELKTKYRCLRRTRGDGNCFFRAFGFSYLERLLGDFEEFSRFKEYASKSKDELVVLGFPQFTVEDFHDVFMEVLQRVENHCGLDELRAVFNDQGHSDYLVVYLRLLVSGYLQKEEAFYSCFLEGARTMKEFCSQEVEPMGRESDHMHITALNAATGVPIRVEYVDRSDTKLNHHDFPEDSAPLITLLYRPGHYDILYT